MDFSKILKEIGICEEICMPFYDFTGKDVPDHSACPEQFTEDILGNAGLHKIKKFEHIEHKDETHLVKIDSQGHPVITWIVPGDQF